MVAAVSVAMRSSMVSPTFIVTLSEPAILPFAIEMSTRLGTAENDGLGAGVVADVEPEGDTEDVNEGLTAAVVEAVVASDVVGVDASFPEQAASSGNRRKGIVSTRRGTVEPFDGQLMAPDQRM